MRVRLIRRRTDIGKSLWAQRQGHEHHRLAHPAKLRRINTYLAAAELEGVGIGATNELARPSCCPRAVADVVYRFHTRAALSTMASRTGCTSVGELADDAEHLASVCAPGLTQFRVALLQFLEQPHVLDRDHRLVGERLKQLDLRRMKGRTSMRRAFSDPMTSS